MGIIDENLFKQSMVNLINEINQNNNEVNEKLKQTIDRSKLEFADVEKLLVARCLETLNKELKAFKEKDMTYDSLKGAWHKDIVFSVNNWDEYKAYEKFFKSLNGYIEAKELNESLRNSFRKYGLKHGGVYYSTYHNSADFSYRMFDLYPGISSKVTNNET